MNLLDDLLPLAPETAPSLFLVDDVRITDIDHDGIGDVLGISKTSLAVRFGDAHATLTSAYSTVTPPQTGPAGFSDLDGDGSLDTSLATPDGIVTYAAPFGLPSPMTCAGSRRAAATTRSLTTNSR